MPDDVESAKPAVRESRDRLLQSEDAFKVTRDGFRDAYRLEHF